MATSKGFEERRLNLKMPSTQRINAKSCDLHHAELAAAGEKGARGDAEVPGRFP
jgi:hypothetical protein